MNGGCAISTLGRLANGELRMLLALIGLCIGACVQPDLVDARAVRAASAPMVVDTPRPWSIVLLLLLSAWAIAATARPWRTRSGRIASRQRIFSERHRLSTAAAIIGASSAVRRARQPRRPRRSLCSA